MQVVFVLSAFMAVATAMMTPSGIYSSQKACAIELGIDMTIFFEVKPSIDFKNLNPKLKCLSKCTLEKMGVIGTDGAFNDKQIPADFKDACIKCYKKNKGLGDACERAHKVGNCAFMAVSVVMKVMVIGCMKETKTKFEMSMGGSSKFGKMEEMVKDDKTACFNRCLMIKMKKMDENNEIIVNALTDFAPDSLNVADTVKTCSENNNQADKCIKASHRGMCVFEAFKKNMM